MSEIDLKSVASAFFVRLLRPAARLLLRHGISFRELSELCKAVYVDAATTVFAEDGKPANDSRVALMTGMTRRDVRHVRRGDNAGEAQAIGRMNMAGRVLSGWFQDEAFLDPAGNPAPLTEAGPAPSFHELAKRYAADVPVTATLKELRRSGAVVEDSDGKLRAVSRDYMPGIVDPTAPEALTRSGSVLEDIGDTVEHNLVRARDEKPRFERRASNINIDPACIDDFRKFVNAEGQAFLERVDTWLTEHEIPKDKQSDRAPVRLGLGMYWIQGSAR